MAKHLSEEIIEKLCHAKNLYYQLIIVLGPAAQAKTSALQEVAKRTEAPLININLELSRRMLDLTERQRVLQVHRLLEEIAGESASDVILLDNIEILFDTSLRQDPLRLLQSISRNRAVTTSWNGSIENEHLIYAAPNHHEYRRYPVGGFLMASTKATD